MDDKEKREVTRALGKFTRLGLSMGMSVFLGVFVGKILVQRFAMGNWALIAGALLGIAAAYRTFFKLTMEGLKDK